MDGQPSSKRPGVGSNPTGGSVASGRGSAWQERLSGGQEIAGSNPAAPTHLHASLARPGGGGRSSPSARWPRRPDPHSGDAGSNPAGDTGPPNRPAYFRREVRAPAAEPTNPLPVLAARHRATNAAVEVQLLAGRPMPPSWRFYQAQVSEACRSGFDSRQGLRREGRSHARLITSPP